LGWGGKKFVLACAGVTRPPLDILLSDKSSRVTNNLDLVFLLT
jgi:hypothetical protein